MRAPTAQMPALVALRELVDLARADYRRRERATGIPVAAQRALHEIALHPGIESSALATALRLERSTASNLVRELVERGLIRRQRLRDDRRYVSLEASDKGHAVLLRAGRDGPGLLARSLRTLSPAAQKRLQAALEPLVQAMRGEGGPDAPGAVRRILVG